jgi:hypothetical protein
MAFEFEIKLPGFAGTGTATGGGGLLTGGLMGSLVTGIKSMVDLLGKTVKFMEKSSPYLAGVLGVLNRAFMIFFRPFGDFLATLLRPVAIWLLRMAISFMTWFKDLPSVLKALLTALTLVGAAAVGKGILNTILNVSGATAKDAGGLVTGALGKGFSFVNGVLQIAGVLLIGQAISELSEGKIINAMRDGVGGALLITAGIVGGVAGLIIAASVVVGLTIFDDKAIEDATEGAKKIHDTIQKQLDSIKIPKWTEEEAPGITKKVEEVGKIYQKQNTVLGFGAGIMDRWLGTSLVGVINQQVGGRSTTEVPELLKNPKQYTEAIELYKNSFDKTKGSVELFNNSLNIQLKSANTTLTNDINTTVIPALDSEGNAVQKLIDKYNKLSEAKNKTSGKISSYTRGVENREKYGLPAINTYAGGY